MKKVDKDFIGIPLAIVAFVIIVLAGVALASGLMDKILPH